MLVSSEHGYGLGSAFFKVTSHKIGQTPQPPQLADLKDPTFGALTPDGKLLLQMGNPQCTNGALTFPRAPNNFMLVPGPMAASLVDTATGKIVESKGLNAANFMWMPQFSPKGDKVVFNHAKLVSGVTDRHELGIMDFDQATRTFSNLRVISTRQDMGVARSDYHPMGGVGEIAGPISHNCTPALPGGWLNPSEESRGAISKGSCSGPCYPAWPFFTPDGNGVIYSLTSEPDFAVAFPGRDKSAKSELWYVDLTTGERVRLDNANKVLGQNGLNNYYPTVLPVQVGGYYWVFFTSMRQWGTRVFEGSILDEAAFGESAKEGIKKRLWVAAIKPRVKEGGEFETGALTDPSMPAFYLEGQSNTGNTRAFAALNPCKATGNTCTSGLDCCTGFCDINEDKTEGVCVEEVTCSSLNERCEADEDCCAPGQGETQNTCIGGYCGFLIF